MLCARVYDQLIHAYALVLDCIKRNAGVLMLLLVSTVRQKSHLLALCWCLFLFVSSSYCCFAARIFLILYKIFPTFYMVSAKESIKPLDVASQLNTRFVLCSFSRFRIDSPTCIWFTSTEGNETLIQLSSTVKSLKKLIPAKSVNDLNDTPCTHCMGVRHANI